MPCSRLPNTQPWCILLYVTSLCHHLVPQIEQSHLSDPYHPQKFLKSYSKVDSIISDLPSYAVPSSPLLFYGGRVHFFLSFFFFLHTFSQGLKNQPALRLKEKKKGFFDLLLVQRGVQTFQNDLESVECARRLHLSIVHFKRHKNTVVLFSM